jgi:hypothetical protein
MQSTSTSPRGSKHPAKCLDLCSKPFDEKSSSMDGSKVINDKKRLQAINSDSNTNLKPGFK